MNLHGLRTLDFKTCHTKTGGDNAFKKLANVPECARNENENVDSKKASDYRVADDQHVNDKPCKTVSRKYSFLHRQTSSEIFKNPLPIKGTPKNISLEDLKANLKQNKTSRQSRFKFFNRDSILNLHLKGGDIGRNKKGTKKEYDTTVLFDSASPNKAIEKKTVNNEGSKRRKKPLDDTFGFLKNNRSISSCYRLNHNFINLDQCLGSLNKFKKRKLNNNQQRNKNKITKHCTCFHYPLKVLNSISSSMMDSSCRYNLVTPNVYTTNATFGNKNTQRFKTETENNTASRNQNPNVKTATKKKKSPRTKGAAKIKIIHECECPLRNNWGEQLEPPFKLKKDVFVSVSSSSLAPKVQCGCDAAVGTNKNQLRTQNLNQTDHKCCQMKRNTSQMAAGCCKAIKKPLTHNLKKIEKERLKELAKEERNTFFTDFISNVADFRVGQTKQRFPVQCMRYIFLGLLVVVWSPCLLALFLGWVIMCPQRISSSLGGPQLLKQMQMNSNVTLNIKKKRSVNETHRTQMPMNTPVNYVNCLPTTSKNTNVLIHHLVNTDKNKSSVSVHQRAQVPMNTFAKYIQNKCLPHECQGTKMPTHSLLKKAKRKTYITNDERSQESSNIVMNYFRNKWPISECPRPQKSNYVKTTRQKNFMSSVASWCTRTVASFNNAVSVVKLIGFKQPPVTHATFMPSTNLRNRCNLYYGKGRGWVVKPQIVQNMRCEYSPDLRLTTSSKDGILKPKSKASFPECQEFVHDSNLKSKREGKNIILRACNAELDSHFSTVPFDTQNASANHQVNIVPKKFEARIEYPYKPGALHNCKHRQIPTKGNMFFSPNYVVVPMHGIVLGYHGNGSGHYHRVEKSTNCTSKFSNKQSLLSKHVSSNLHKSYKPMVIDKSQKLSNSCKTCLTNKPSNEPRSNQYSKFALNTSETRQPQIVRFKSDFFKKQTNSLQRHSAISLSKISQKSPTRPSHKKLHGKLKPEEGQPVDNYSYKQHYLSDTRASKAGHGTCKVAETNKNLPKHVTDEHVNIKTNSSKAFNGALNFKHIKQVASVIKQKNRPPFLPYKFFSDSKPQNSIIPSAGKKKADKTQELLQYSELDNIEGYRNKQRILCISDERLEKLKTAARVDKHTKRSQSRKYKNPTKLSPIESLSTLQDVYNVRKRMIPFEKVCTKCSCKSRKMNEKLQIIKETPISCNIHDQIKTPNIETEKQMTCQSFDKATKCSKRVQKNKFHLHTEESIQFRKLEQSVHHTSDIPCQKMPNFTGHHNQAGVCLSAACDQETWNKIAPSITLFELRKLSSAANPQRDKACSSIQSFKSLQYQRFSEGLNKKIVPSKSCRSNQSQLVQHKAPPHRCNSMHPKNSKQLINLTKINYTRNFPTCRKPFKRNNPDDSMISLRQKQQILDYNLSQNVSTSYKKKYLPMSVSSIMDTSSNSKSRSTSAHSITKSYTFYRKRKPLKYTLFRQATSSYSIYPRDNLLFSRRFYIPRNYSSLSNHFSSSLHRNSVLMDKCDSSSMHASRRLQSILCKFKSYDEYERTKDKKISLVGLQRKPIFKQNLQLYPNLINNTRDKTSTFLPKKIQTAHINKKFKRTPSINNSVIVKPQIKTDLIKRLRYLNQLLMNNTALFECYNKRYDARTRKTDTHLCRSKEMNLKCLHYPKNHDHCTVCKTSYLTGKIQLLRQLLGKAGPQENSHKITTKRTRTPRCLSTSHRPQLKQSSTLFDPRAMFNLSRRSRKSQMKLFGNPLCCCVQKQLCFPVTLYQGHQKPLECTADWYYKTVNYPSMEFQMQQCPQKCFQNLLDYLHTHSKLTKRQSKSLTSIVSKRILASPKCSDIKCCRAKCEKKSSRNIKRQLSSQDNLLANYGRKGNIKKMGKELKRTCSPKRTVERRKNLLINNEAKQRNSPVIKNYTRNPPRSKDKMRRKVLKSKNKKRPNSQQGKVERQKRKKVKRKRLHKKRIKKALPKRNEKKRNNGPKRKKKKKAKIKTKKRRKSPKLQNRRKGFLMNIVDTIRQAEAAAWPIDFKCNRMFIQTLKKRPCLWIYKLWPSIYPSFLRLRILIKRILTILLLCVCSPLQLCAYFCIESIISCGC